MDNNIDEFVVLKTFNINIHVSKASKIFRVVWNRGGATNGNTGFATSTSIFRGSKGNTKMASLHTTYENPDFVTPTSINVFIV